MTEERRAPALELSSNARVVLERRYLARDEAGRLIETPEELLRRVARAVAAPEARWGRDPEEVAERFYGRMAALELLPNSPTLMNAGREPGQLAACFVLPIEDSVGEIFDAVKWAAQIQLSGGGTGFDFSRLRPAGDRVASTPGVASGPVSFLDLFDAATASIKQGGMRRGANMAILRVDHPDVLDFITAKLEPGRLANFNVSVAITDEFMAAVTAGAAYALRSPRTGHEVRRLPARRVFDLIVQCAWRSGEPGVVFIDRINADNPTPGLGPLAATNPCSEQPLLPFESCVLGSIDVGKLTRGARGEATVDWPRLAAVVHDGVRFLDDLIEANRYPLPQIEAVTRANRKIGLGVMGFADLLVRLGLPYDGEAAVALGRHLMGFVEAESLAASAALAEERGPFPSFGASRWARDGHRPLRNATTTTVAPTGTLSILAGCSGGIEPLFALAFVRRVLDGAELPETYAPLAEELARRGLTSAPLLARIAETGRLRGLPGVPPELGALYATAYDVSPTWHVRMQAAFQAHVHAAVSKTINFPAEATVEDVALAYRLAYDLGCKGVTVYRDGSRAHQVLSTGATPGGAAPTTPPPCPDCGGPTEERGGCALCVACGYSRCVV